MPQDIVIGDTTLQAITFAEITGPEKQAVRDGLGLGSAATFNTAALPISDATQTALTGITSALSNKAPLASPDFSGVPLADTAAPGTNSRQIASTAYVRTALAALVNSAPGTLDTLKELADALGGDANFAATIAAAVGLKAPSANPTFTGTVTVPTPAVGDSSTNAASTAFNARAIRNYDRLAFLRRAMMDAGPSASPWTRPYMSSPPTITKSASALAGCTTILTFLADQSKFNMPDMVNYWISSSIYMRPYNSVTVSGTSNNDDATTSGTHESWAGGVFFDAFHYGQKICFRGLFQGTDCIQIVVDGQLTSSSMYDFNSGNGYLNIDFGSVTQRRIQLRQGPYPLGLNHIAIEPTAMLWKPYGSRKMQVAGDSISIGAGSGSGGTIVLSWARLFADFCGFDICMIEGQSGTGFGRVAAYGTYASRLAYTIQSDADVIVLQGSVNDQTGNTTAPALATFQQVRAANANALIIVTGLIAGRTAANLVVENELKAAYDSWADSNKMWLPSMTATGGAHFTGLGDISNPTGSGISDSLILYELPLPVHPITPGHIHAARRMYNEKLGQLKAAGV